MVESVLFLSVFPVLTHPNSESYSDGFEDIEEERTNGPAPGGWIVAHIATDQPIVQPS
jgi:hypothetical protein